MRLCAELSIPCAALFDGDQPEELRAALGEFDVDLDVTAFTLLREDIRDKHLRDKRGRETKLVIKRGFSRNGKINADALDRFDLLVESVPTFFQTRGLSS